MIPLVSRSSSFLDNRAIISDGQSYTYKDLLDRSAEIAAYLLGSKKDLEESRIAFMVTPGFDYVAVQWGIWRAGGVAVPLCITYPEDALHYVVEDTQAIHIIASEVFCEIASSVASRLGSAFSVVHDCTHSSISLPEIAAHRRAMILYTSGTTSKPKGVVSTHKNIAAQIDSLVGAWKWTSQDHILCVLPLHHVHGIINVIGAALWSGATCEFQQKFSAEDVVASFQKGEINLFMAVPTIYYKLISYLDTCSDTVKEITKNCMKNFRLMVSGSAALPVSVMEKWKLVSGQELLERYGMTEIGMGISNPYEGERRPGFVGQPLPGVSIRLADENNLPIQGEPGEIQVKGETVFMEYWQRPEANQSAFTIDGWFKTGDIAEVVDGSYRILGRNSTDIIKSGGYKISLLEIEEVIRSEKGIIDCCVVGLPDEEWGEVIAAALVTSDDFDLDECCLSLKNKLPGYKMPRKFKLLSDLPRNAMGKVTKNELKTLF
jgi:malonyl-CoA/methylmalonyl-CoA synthetase